MHPLILLHGALGAASQFDPLKDQLKDHFNVHSINFSGHGGVTMPEDKFSIPLFANDLKNYLEQNQIQSANIFGYSMGGYVAMYLTKHFPELVDKVITLGTKFYWDEEVASRDIKLLDPDTIIQKVPAFAGELEQRHAPEDWKTVLSKTKEMLLGLGKKNVLQIDDYRTISNDCLLLIGGSDKMVTRDETKNVCDALPNASMKILPEAPHPIEQVNVTLLADLIQNFINA
jgi:pimeloyl-ACP methyl ester carboxylesterase